MASIADRISTFARSFASWSTIGPSSGTAPADRIAVVSSCDRENDAPNANREIATAPMGPFAKTRPDPQSPSVIPSPTVATYAFDPLIPPATGTRSKPKAIRAFPSGLRMSSPQHHNC